jgi:hypothetical protein
MGEGILAWGVIRKRMRRLQLRGSNGFSPFSLHFVERYSNDVRQSVG